MQHTSGDDPLGNNDADNGNCAAYYGRYCIPLLSLHRGRLLGVSGSHLHRPGRAGVSSPTEIV